MQLPYLTNRMFFIQILQIPNYKADIATRFTLSFLIDKSLAITFVLCYTRGANSLLLRQLHFTLFNRRFHRTSPGLYRLKLLVVFSMVGAHPTVPKIEVEAVVAYHMLVVHVMVGRCIAELSKRTGSKSLREYLEP